MDSFVFGLGLFIMVGSCAALAFVINHFDLDHDLDHTTDRRWGCTCWTSPSTCST